MTAPTSQSGTPRRASIGSRRSPETEAAILAAARAVLAERGYAGFSIDEIARRAGAGKPTIYRWWPTKADLFIVLYGIEKMATVPLPDQGDPVADLTRYTLDLWQFWRTNPAGGVLRGLIAEAQSSEAALIVLRDKFLPQRTCDVRLLLGRAADRGAFPPETIEDRVVLWIGFIWLRLLTDDIAADAPLVRRIMQILVASGDGHGDPYPTGAR